MPVGMNMAKLPVRFNTIGKVTLFGFLMSLTIEVLQLPFAVRASDVDDLILNTAGCMVGYGIYALVRFLCLKCK